MALTREELEIALSKHMMSGECANDFSNAMYFICGAEPNMTVSDAIELIEKLIDEDIVDGNCTRAWRRHLESILKGGETSDEAG